MYVWLCGGFIEIMANHRFFLNTTTFVKSRQLTIILTNYRDIKHILSIQERQDIDTFDDIQFNFIRVTVGFLRRIYCTLTRIRVEVNLLLSQHRSRG